MRVAHPHCAGIDVHKQSMTVCVFAESDNGSQPAYHKRRFATHTEGIQELMTWLQVHQVSEVGMEATGVYWKPVWNALEGKYGLHLCNPQHIRAIPVVRRTCGTGPASRICWRMGNCRRVSSLHDGSGNCAI